MNDEDGQILHAIFNMLDALFQQSAEAGRLATTNEARERARLAYQDWLELRKARRATVAVTTPDAGRQEEGASS